jgi:hypothetical protein
VIDIDGKLGILEQSFALEEEIVLESIRGMDFDFDSLVGRKQTVALPSHGEGRQPEYQSERN